MISIYTKVKLNEVSKNLIYEKINQIKLAQYVQNLRSCDCNLIPKDDLHITIKDTYATSVDHVKQAISSNLPPNVNTLGLSERSVEKWGKKYSAFQKVMPEKLCKKLNYIIDNIEFKVDGYSAHFGKFAVITLSVVDNSRTASYLQSNPHISIVKCKGSNAQECLSKADNMKLENYRSIFDVVPKNTPIEVMSIEINADIYGATHTIMSKNRRKDCPNKQDKTEVGHTYQPSIPEPGSGFLKDGEGVKPTRCFSAKNVCERIESGSVVGFKLYRDASFGKIQSMLGVDITSHFSYDKFLTTSAVNYVKNLQETTYTLSSLFYASHILPTKIFDHSNIEGEQILTEFGRNIYENQPADFIKICGDHVITETRMSAVFIANIKVFFETQNNKSTFISSINAKAQNMYELMKEFDNIASNNNMKGSFEISAFQIGGISSELYKVLGHNDKGQYHAITCSFNNTNACLSTVNDIAAYGGNFSSQITNNNSNGLVSGFSKVKVTDFLFSKKLNGYSISDTDKQLRKDIHQYYDNVIEYREILEKIIHSNKVINNIDKSGLDKLKEYYKKSDTLINSAKDADQGVMQCYQPDGNCQSFFINFKKEYDSYDTDFIEAFSNKYSLTIEFSSLISFFNSNVEKILYPTMETKDGGYQYLSKDKIVFNPVSKIIEFISTKQQKILEKLGDTYFAEISSNDALENLSSDYPSICNFPVDCIGRISINKIDILD